MDDAYDRPMSDPVPNSIPWWHPPALPVTTTFEFPGWKVDRIIGPCFGLVVRSLGIGRGLGASLQGISGGEVVQYTQLLEETRQQAMDRLIYHAQILGANGIIGMRFDSSGVAQTLTEIVAYGTAVLVSVDDASPHTAQTPAVQPMTSEPPAYTSDPADPASP